LLPRRTQILLDLRLRLSNMSGLYAGESMGYER